MNDDVRLGLQKAEEFLNDAELLFESGRYESTVNRAYYCMFKVVQTILLDKDIFTKTHKGARVKFHELFLKTNLLPEHLGEMFDDASELRQDADYDFEKNVSESGARKTIENASLFLNAVKGFLEK